MSILPNFIILCSMWLFTNGCPDLNNHMMPCNIQPPVDGLSCSYVKGGISSLINSNNVPNAVNNLRVAPGYKTINGKCTMILNVTWNVLHDNKLQYLQGFNLRYRFMYNGQEVMFNRTFTVNSNLSNIYQATFTHQCVVPSQGSLYRIEVFSLPMNRRKHRQTIRYRAPSFTSSPPYACNQTSADPRNSAAWVAMAWAKPNPSRSLIDFCFYTAPSPLNFNEYLVSLLHSESDPMNIAIEQKRIAVNASAGIQHICQKFLNICSGTYKIWITPANEFETCRNNGMIESCTVTSINLINMATARTC